MRLLFVCLGNICRSPTAEGIMKTLIEKEKLEHKIQCDSAGTSGYHEGEPADGRMRQHALERGYKLTSLSRPFTPQDFTDFDLILVMDKSNYRDVMKLDPKGDYRSKVRPMVDYCTNHQVDHVPDPYYEGDEGFRLVIDILEDACGELLRQIHSKDL